MSDRLAGKRILVVEDEYLIASDLTRLLQKEGAVVVGPTASLSGGLSLLDAGMPDAAVLDVSIEGATSFAIADALAGRAVPYMFVTGYDGWALPERYRQITRMTKPFSFRALIAEVERMVDEDARR